MEFTAYTPSMAATAIALTAIRRAVLDTLRAASKAFFSTIDPFIFLLRLVPGGISNARHNKSFGPDEKNGEPQSKARQTNIPMASGVGMRLAKCADGAVGSAIDLRAQNFQASHPF
jgi:hypothetical protein